MCSLETHQRVTYIHVYKFRFQEQQTYLVNTTHMLFQLGVIWIVIYLKDKRYIIDFSSFYFKPLAQMDRHVGYICVQFWFMRKFILDISLYRFMVLLCSYTESKLSHFFFSGKSKVKCNYIVMFMKYSCINVNCNVPASDKHFYRTLLNSILSKIYLSPSFDSS